MPKGPKGMMGSLALLMCLTAAWPQGPAAAGEDPDGPALEPGARIRVELAAEPTGSRGFRGRSNFEFAGAGDTYTGTLLRRDAEALVIRCGDGAADSLRVPLARVRSIKVGSGSPHAALGGALLGLAAGLVLAGHVNARSEPAPDDWFGLRNMEEQMSRGLAYTVIGTALGAVVGQQLGGEKWRSADLTETAGREASPPAACRVVFALAF